MKVWGTNHSRKEHDKVSEAMIISAFIDFKKYFNYKLDIISDPPDAIIRMPKQIIWLEVSFIVEQKRAQYLYNENHIFESDLSEKDHIELFIDKIIQIINLKDSKQSYLELKKKYGKGILLFEIIDPFISVIENSEIKIANKILKFYQNKQLNYFKEIYLYRIAVQEGPREFLKLF